MDLNEGLAFFDLCHLSSVVGPALGSGLAGASPRPTLGCQGRGPWPVRLAQNQGSKGDQCWSTYVFAPTTDRDPRAARGQSCQCPEVYRTTNRRGQEPYCSQRAEGGPPCPQLWREPPASEVLARDAELFQWILEQVRTAFCLHGWQEDERMAERLAQRVWCALEREEQRCYAFSRQLGKGRVRFPRRTATLWALPWTPLRLGGSEQSRNMP